MPRRPKTMRRRLDAWLGEHEALARVAVCVAVAAALVGLFLFVTFSGFGSSAEFIYNQF